MPNQAPLEDLFEDIVAKAQKGLGLTHRELAAQLQMELESVRKLEAGCLDAGKVESLAKTLSLSAGALQLHHDRQWPTPEVELSGVKPFRESFYEGAVNSYVLEDEVSKVVLVFDAGLTGQSLLTHLQSLSRPPTALFLTHLHRDHTGILETFARQWPDQPIFAPHEEISGPSSYRSPPERIGFGPIGVRSLSTPGHSPGGTSYLVQGQENQFCFVGDAIFAGSIGGCSGDAYSSALAAIQNELLSLPPETILLPGHGPATTVAHERQYNPFFPNLSP